MSHDFLWKACRRASAVACVVWLAGCAPPQTYHRPLEPVADRLVRAYPDLSSGRFLIVADFEAVEQGAIFRLAPPTAAGYVGIVSERARPETGAGSLKVRFTSGEQELVIEDVGQGSWTLARDWRRFHLLLISVYSPRTIAGAVLTARSGSQNVAEYQQRGILLHEGWNLLRIDIGDLAERIDVADVRQLRFGCPRLEEPVDLFFDDIVLADNAKDVLASPAAQPGDLYVRAEGRRLRVGVVEQFELVFSRGKIVQWFDLRTDPNRIHNLTGGGALGPTPVVVSAGADGPMRVDEMSGWEKLGTTAESYQKLMEASPVRAMVWGEWRFGSPATASAPGAEAPFHRWVYTIYATGKMYVEFAGTVQTAPLNKGRAASPGVAGEGEAQANAVAGGGSDAGSVGYLVSCADAEGFQRLLHPPSVAGADAPAAADGLNYVLYHQNGPDKPDLLFTFYRARTAPKARALRHDEEPRLGTLFYGGPADAVTVWAAMFTVWPHDIDGPQQAEPMALDYTNPMPLTVDAGRLIRTDPGDIDNDGFNETRGHYTLEPDGNVVKARLDGSKRMRFGPVFKIVDVSDCDVWAYVDGIEIRPVARDVDANAIFQIPRVLDKETLVEVTIRRKTPTTQGVR
jgi:hypothetical protein